MKHQPPMREQFQQVLPLRQSTLVKIVLVLTFMPNVVITIMNYQFNFAADAYFASESGLLGFFSYFRGVLNIISPVLLLFVGRLYGRFSLPVALMFHTFNYIIAFIAFLRGTVVRVALFVGSGLILASANLFHPRYLSLVALPFVLVWLVAQFVLKRKYAAILMDLISRNMLDKKSMEQQNPATRIRLLEMLSDNPGPGTAEMLQRILFASNEPELTVAVIRTIHRTGSGNPAIRDRLKTLTQHPHPEVRGNAAGCLYMKTPGKLKPKIDTWLYSREIDQRKAGVIAAGRTGEKGYAGIKQIRLDTMGPGDYFKEMALFKETKRSATIRTLKPARFLLLDKPEFNELVREYPGIALQICTALSQRLRHLQSMVADAEARTGSQKDAPCK
ncbi:MAG: cyclic nucleotide-binding domain-containing protein [Desulfosalsimonas sp.]|uniref:cyclic nucleotide-binding domain-containing protein n=1 Tax=Desulfosalsimonas sp. TaxID=3073848 RepID=UPI00397065C8